MSLLRTALGDEFAVISSHDPTTRPGARSPSRCEWPFEERWVESPPLDELEWDAPRLLIRIAPKIAIL
jgi:hypothetical protein